MNQSNLKVAVITGAGSGIGEAVACRLLDEGWAVVAVDQNDAGLEQYESPALSGRTAIVVGDVTVLATHDEARDRAQQLGVLHAWISVAGVTEAHALDDLDVASARRLIDINQMGPLLGAAAAVGAFRSRSTPGVIVQISSVHASRAAVGYPVYEMTKAAMEALTRSIAVTYGDAGVRSVGIAPGAILTPALSASIERSPDSVSASARLAGASPLGVVGVPTDIADAVVFVVSDRARFITGTTITVDGGWTSALFTGVDSVGDLT